MKQGNKIIPEAGRIFKLANRISFTLPYDTVGYEILDINLDNISLDSLSEYAYIDNKFAVKIEDKTPLKGRLINKVFSNDDELAILLNYQASKTAQNKEKLEMLQSWRDWFGNLANIIENKLIESHE